MTIKRIAFCLTILVSFYTGKAQKAYQGHLWKISGNGLEEPSFLYGTMHVSSKVAFHLSDSFYKAIESVDVVALEINPETWMETMTTDPYVADNYGNAFSMRRDYAEDGFYTSIFQLKEPKNKDIGGALSQELGILNSLLYRTSNSGADFQEDTYLDLFIYQAGRKQGKEVTGLEELGSTMRLSELASKPEPDRKIRKELKKESERREHLAAKLLDGKRFGEVMEDAYRNGDLDLLDSLSRLSSSKKNHDYIIVYRNKLMADNMDSIMQEKSLFAGIGAAHLPNTYGVIELLRDKGYAVNAVDNSKTEFGRQKKDDLEESFISQPFKEHTSFDGLYSVTMPGVLYEFPESGNTMLAAYPDMPNGATYVITRVFTFAPLYGKTQDQYMSKIDSLLFENIPGKILQKERITVNGIPGFDIKNKTKKGDLQRYRIMVTPLEVLVFKLGGKKAFAERSEVDAFFSKLKFNLDNDRWNSYSPKNNAYKVDLPGTPVFEGENNEFMRGFWKKTVQSYDEKNGYFAVLNRSYTDWEYIEEDSFELYQMASHFLIGLDYSVVSSNSDSFGVYSCVSMTAEKEDLPKIHLKCISKGDQYYLIIAQTNDTSSLEKFQSSFEFTDFKYRRPFEVKHDTTRMFSVYTNVRPPVERSYYRYYDDDDSDNSHEEEEKTAVYYSKETDESVYVRFKKFHRYYGESVIDSIWKENKKLITEDNSLLVREEKSWFEDGMNFQQIQVGDTNSNRNFLARFILNESVMYTLATELDTKKPRSTFIDSFYSTFTPWDTTLGPTVLKSKTKIYLSDLVSDDSTTREAAFDSWWTVNFEDDDAPSLIEAYSQHFNTEHGIDLRRYILYALGDLKHSACTPFLEKTFKEIGDTMDFQVAILTSLANQKSKKSAALFSKLLLDETPLTDMDEVETMFSPFYDSLELAKGMFPDLLLLSSLNEYKITIYDLLRTMLDSNVIKPKAYKRQLKQIVWEANNSLKRQKSQHDYAGNKFYEDASRYQLYSYSPLLDDYVQLLLPFYGKSSVHRFFNRVEKFNVPGLQLDLAISKLKNGIGQEESVWENFCSNENDIVEVYDRLKAIDRLDLFPKSVTKEDLFKSQYAQSAYLNLFKDSIIYVHKEYLELSKDTGTLYFYKVKEKTSTDDEWTYGYIGLLDDDVVGLPKIIPYSNNRIRYSKYEDEMLQIKMATRKIEMGKWRRYKVEDEPEFEELKNGGGRYFY